VSKDKTVIFSTHIMQEVQALCSRVLIINNGKLVADNVPEKLKSEAAATVVITLEFKEEVPTEELSGLEGILAVRKTGKTILVEASAEADVRPLIFKFATTKGYTLVGMNQEASTMEDVFRQLTKKS